MTLPTWELIGNGKAQIDGDAGVLHGFIAVLDPFDFWFNIVTPN